jgi:hypothetical protein
VGGATFTPPDMTKADDLRLSFYDGHLFFDYVDVNGSRKTMVYNEAMDVWGQDEYTAAAVTHYGEEGRGLNSLLMGSPDGHVYQLSGEQDNGVDFPARFYMPMIGDLDSYLHARDGQIAIMAPDDVTLIANVDGADYPVVVPSTGGAYDKEFVNCQPVKGKAWAWAVTSTKGFKLFAKDTYVNMKSWGSEGPYQRFYPFADLERQSTGYVRPVPISTGGGSL